MKRTIDTANAADLAILAADVAAVAPSVAVRGFAFVADIAAALAVNDSAAFKAALAECCRLGLLDLARCDMVQAYDARRVNESKIESGMATWHGVWA